ncbi:glycosyltransferase [Sphingomonas sp. M6A6_1c]
MNWLSRLIAGVKHAVHPRVIQLTFPSPASVASARPGKLPSTSVSQDALVAIDEGQKQDSADELSISTSESANGTIPLSRNAPMVFLVVGRLNDRKGYTAAIRAFALAGRLGDRLTLRGYGRHRWRLERWAEALGIDAVVTFHEPNRALAIDLLGVDVVISVSHDPRFLSPLILSALARDVTIIAANENEKARNLFRNYKNVTLVNIRDIAQLSLAIARIKLLACKSKSN